MFLKLGDLQIIQFLNDTFVASRCRVGWTPGLKMAKDAHNLRAGDFCAAVVVGAKMCLSGQKMCRRHCCYSFFELFGDLHCFDLSYVLYICVILHAFALGTSSSKLQSLCQLHPHVNMTVAPAKKTHQPRMCKKYTRPSAIMVHGVNPRG